MQSERPWDLEAVLMLTAGLLLSLAGGLVAIAALHQYGPKLSLGQEKFSSFLISTVTFQGASLGLTHFLLRRHQLTWGEFLGWRLPHCRRAVLLGMATGALVLPGTYLLSSISEVLLTLLQGPPDAQPTVQVLQLSVGVAQRLTFGAAAIVVAPICEEILFRGILYRVIKQFGWPKLALVTSSLFFGFIHSNPMTLVPLSFLAVVLAVLYDRTGNLMAPIVAHSFFNAVNFSTFLLQGK